MKKILVTGANGQLGRCIKDVAKEHPNLDFYFVDRTQLNVGDSLSTQQFFHKNKFDYCINTAAYTNVDKAESEKEAAFLTNAEGVKYLSEACKENNIVLIHISTDYVFDGRKTTPYIESDSVNPINVYGASKLKGEEYIQKICSNFFIFRTSWLYSQYGNNFLKSMLRFAEEKRDLSITTEQTGTPTNANDLARVVVALINLNNKNYGLYHFSNKGKATWYDFAKAIFSFSGQIENVKLAKTVHYRTFAKRPAYSVLNKDKFLENFTPSLIHWEESLEQLIKNIRTINK